MENAAVSERLKKEPLYVVDGSGYICCRKSPHITYAIKSFGEWDYEVDIEVSSVEELRSTVRVLTREHAAIIRDYDTLAISAIHKYNLFPD